uniref:Uncharacterized protein n=1 Tax=Ditylenchus dipsaci TaxID=166011 RepID=A0A915CL63_9BILA
MATSSPTTVTYNGATANLSTDNIQTQNNGGNLNESHVNVETGQPSHSVKDMRNKGLPWILTACAIVIIVLCMVLCFFLYKEYYSATTADPTDPFALTGFTSTSLPSKEDARKAWPTLSPATSLARFPKAAVVSDNGLCSEIGRNILLRGGNAVDSAIATIACVGALNAHSSGLGGGFLMTFYNHFYSKCTSLDARETAPLNTHRDTFASNPKDAVKGYKSVATPGELHGYWTAYKRFGSGRISWQDLLIPTVHLLTNGYPVSKLMEVNLRIRQEEIMNEPSMRNFFVNNVTNELYKEGEVLKNPQLAETFRKLAISSDPVKLFYGGEIGKQIADEIGENDGFITKKDLETYRTVIDTTPLLIVSIMSKFYPIGSDSSIPYSSVDYYHRLIEAQKFAYAQRSFLGDPKFIPKANSIANNMTTKEFTDYIVGKISSETLALEEYGGDNSMAPDEHGTSHVSVIDADGNAVSLTSSVNNIFGALVRSDRLGIVWNDQMDDFSRPGSTNFFGFEPSKANYIEPGKRPLSSMSPVIIYDKQSKQVKASMGASGGSKIISSLSQVILQTINFNHTIKEAIDAPRLHNQFTPYITNYEKGFPDTLVAGLQAKGQNMTQMKFPFSTLQAIVRNEADGSLMANSDHRRPIYMYPTGY